MNEIYGTAKNDTIFGTDGRDEIIGDIGNDTLTGGKGENIYVFFEGDGHDVIKPTKGEYISIQYFANDSDTLTIDDFEIETVGSDVVIKRKGFYDESITIKGLSKKELAEQVVLEGFSTNLDYADFYASISSSWDSGMENYYFEYTEADANSKNVINTGILNQKVDLSGAPIEDSDKGYTVNTGSGADYIIGSKNNDNLTGGTGTNIYEFRAGCGHDVINPTKNESIEIRYIAEESNGSGENGAFTVDDFEIETVGSDVVIKRKGYDDDSITIKSLSKKQLAEFVRFSVGRVGEMYDDFYVSFSSLYSAGNDYLFGYDYEDANSKNILTTNFLNQKIDLSGAPIVEGGKGYTVNAGAGHDYIISSNYNDKLTGGSGDNTYEFREGFGHDVITPTKGESIVIKYIAKPSETELSRTDFIFEDNGSDIVITRNGVEGDSITIKGLSKKDAAEFIFFEAHREGQDFWDWHTSIVGDDESLFRYTHEQANSKNQLTTDHLNQSIDLSSSTGGKGYTVNAGGGNDVIVGSCFDDKITGGKGNNRFEYREFNGDDVVYLTKGESLTIDYYGSVDLFEKSIDDYFNIVQKGSDVVISRKDIENAGSITVKGLAKKEVADYVEFMVNGDYDSAFSLQNKYGGCYKFDITDKVNSKNVLKGTYLSEKVDLSGVENAKEKGYTINTGNGESVVVGSKYADKITGGIDFDIIEGGKGNDTITGGKGETIVVFNEGDGQDVVNFTKGEFLIIEYRTKDMNIDEYSFSFEENGPDVVIRRGDDSITIKNMAKKDLEGTIGFSAKYWDEDFQRWEDVFYNYNEYEFGYGKDNYSGYYIDLKKEVDTYSLDENNGERGVIQGSYLDEYFYLENAPAYKKGKGYTIKTGNGYTIKTGNGSNEVIGSDYDDKIYTGNNGSNEITARGGNDTIYVGKDANQFNFSVGDGHDVIYNSSKGDRIHFNTDVDFRDLNMVRNGNDLWIGYSENDSVTLKSFFKQKDEERLDNINGFPVSYHGKIKVTGSGTIKGTKYDEDITGSAKADKITTGAGIDTIEMGRGNDTLTINGAGHKKVTIYQTDGNDTIKFADDVNADLELEILGSRPGNLWYEKKGEDTIIIHRDYEENGVQKSATTTLTNVPASALAYGDIIVNGQDLGEILQRGMIVTPYSSKYNELIGGDGDDTIYGSNGDDFILTGTGYDIVNIGAKGSTYIIDGRSLYEPSAYADNIYNVDRISSEIYIDDNAGEDSLGVEDVKFSNVDFVFDVDKNGDPNIYNGYEVSGNLIITEKKYTNNLLSGNYSKAIEIDGYKQGTAYVNGNLIYVQDKDAGYSGEIERIYFQNEDGEMTDYKQVIDDRIYAVSNDVRNYLNNTEYDTVFQAYERSSKAEKTKCMEIFKTGNNKYVISSSEDYKNQQSQVWTGLVDKIGDADSYTITKDFDFVNDKLIISDETGSKDVLNIAGDVNGLAFLFDVKVNEDKTYEVGGLLKVVSKDELPSGASADVNGVDVSGIDIVKAGKNTITLTDEIAQQVATFLSNAEGSNGTVGFDSTSDYLKDGGDIATLVAVYTSPQN